MPLYFFHIQGDAPDTEGTEISDLQTAKCEAVKYVGRLICEAASDFWNYQEMTMNVADGDGRTLFSLLFVGVEAPVKAPFQLPVLDFKNTKH
jgi:hypothetical protein